MTETPGFTPPRLVRHPPVDMAMPTDEHTPLWMPTVQAGRWLAMLAHLAGEAVLAPPALPGRVHALDARRGAGRGSDATA